LDLYNHDTNNNDTGNNYNNNDNTNNKNTPALPFSDLFSHYFVLFFGIVVTPYFLFLTTSTWLDLNRNNDENKS
jgi:hypothetical protein